MGKIYKRPGSNMRHLSKWCAANGANNLSDVDEFDVDISSISEEKMCGACMVERVEKCQ
jgi:hypothetical protein